MTPPLSPDRAWLPLPDAQWDASAARHLLRRVGWSALPEEVERATREGLSATLDRLLPKEAPAFSRPKLVQEEADRVSDFRIRVRNAADVKEKRAIQRERRELSRKANRDFALRWLQQAARPENAAFEKWLLFLGDVYVVATDKVTSANLIFDHWQILRENALGAAPDLTKAVSRSGAMMGYLDLQRSSKRAPNENFARELMELFTLGEGHYTEKDIKEIARAFTGYRYRQGGFHFDRGQFDGAQKTIFGQTGFFRGDDVVDLIYRQAAAGTFLPREMTRFYLTDDVFDADYFAPLGEWWRGQNYALRALFHRYFSSAIFYHPGYRANYIKSPIHYLLGLVQDLRLDVTPLAQRTLTPLRQMGQEPFNPPNVRGWVGGQLWINASTLAARRQLVFSLFAPIYEKRINADDKRALDAARAEGYARFTVDKAHLETLAKVGVEGIVDRLTTYFLPTEVTPAYRKSLIDFLSDDPTPNVERVHDAAIAVLQTPPYQLC